MAASVISISFLMPATSHRMAATPKAHCVLGRSVAKIRAGEKEDRGGRVVQLVKVWFLETMEFSAA